VICGTQGPRSPGRLSTESAGPDRHPVELIAERLEAVLRFGVRPAKLVACLDLLALLPPVGLPDPADPYVRAIELAERLNAALNAFGDGPSGRALQALFGSTPDTRGRPLKDRRRLAAEELDLMPSTFRKYYEHDLIADLALHLWRAAP
jgi:hypothetical protein